ncbi:uncharacterized protein LOC106653782 [Trichogramma pretiosum]|uniref:uncharacterized protein LOC106653782 n=1 Tax=Trichogramma pretiosum TaxID=7493 RepID=UPI0006C97094|nr:uncharacterized protein LOC106653782 [Trichogramma pretiosum]
MAFCRSKSDKILKTGDILLIYPHTMINDVKVLVDDLQKNTTFTPKSWWITNDEEMDEVGAYLWAKNKILNRTKTIVFDDMKVDTLLEDGTRGDVQYPGGPQDHAFIELMQDLHSLQEQGMELIVVQMDNKEELPSKYPRYTNIDFYQKVAVNTAYKYPVDKDRFFQVLNPNEDN